NAPIRAATALPPTSIAAPSAKAKPALPISSASAGIPLARQSKARELSAAPPLAFPFAATGPDGRSQPRVARRRTQSISLVRRGARCPPAAGLRALRRAARAAPKLARAYNPDPGAPPPAPTSLSAIPDSSSGYPAGFDSEAEPFACAAPGCRFRLAGGAPWRPIQGAGEL